MTNETRSPDEIERDIERERSALTNTLDDLQQKFSVESIARQFSDHFREHGGDIGRSVSEAVKRNPVALALTGVGLAWLMMGDSASPRLDRGRQYGRSDRDDRFEDDRAGSAGSPRRDVTRLPQAHDRPVGSAANPARTYEAGRFSSSDNTPSWARPVERHDDTGPGAGTRLRDSATHAGEAVSGAAASASAAARTAGGKVSDGVKGASDAVSHAGQSTVEGAQRLASNAAERASALRERLAEGTESLTEEARNRVIAARERAIEARDAVMSYGREGRDRAVDLYEDQPLVAGALALAIGAAIGAALPSSRTEDQYMGDYSDSLMHEAERIYAEEKEKLTKVAKVATDEARKIAEETRQAADEAAPGVLDKVKSSGQRIVDAAGDEAQKQKLGDVQKS